MEEMKIVADPKRPYKAIVTIVLAALTAAGTIWTDNPYIGAALAVLTALGAFLTPNPLVSVPLNPPTDNRPESAGGPWSDV